MKRWTAVLLSSPAVALCVLFVIAPLFMVGRLSFLRTDFIRTVAVGFGNYKELLTDGTVFVNSFLYVLFMVPLSTAVPLFIALTLIDTPKWLQPIARFALYTPAVSAGIIVSQAWRWIFHPSAGLVNHVLSTIGIEPVLWFTTRWTSIPVISGIIGITGFGPTVLIYGAVLLAVDPEIQEQAVIDGASRRQVKWRIMAPIVWPTISLVMLLALSSSLQHFETLYVMAPYEYAENLMYGVYRNGFLFGRFGFAAAETIILVALSAAVIGIKQWRFG